MTVSSRGRAGSCRMANFLFDRVNATGASAERDYHSAAISRNGRHLSSPRKRWSSDITTVAEDIAADDSSSDKQRHTRVVRACDLCLLSTYTHTRADTGCYSAEPAASALDRRTVAAALFGEKPQQLYWRSGINEVDNHGSNENSNHMVNIQRQSVRAGRAPHRSTLAKKDSIVWRWRFFQKQQIVVGAKIYRSQTIANSERVAK